MSSTCMTFVARVAGAAIAPLLILAVASTALRAQSAIGPFDVLPRSHVTTYWDLYLRTTVADLDRDGRPEMVVPTLIPSLPAGRFVALRLNDDDEWTQMPIDMRQAPSNLGLTPFNFCAAVGDIDGDGWPDVIVAQRDLNNPAYRTPALCYRNDRQGGFTYDPSSGLQDLPRRDHPGAHLFDADGDGDLDLYLFGTPYNPDLLLHNDGTGRFTDVTATHLPSEAPGLWTMWVASTDLDGDGRNDLFIARTGSEALVFRNQGNGSFAISQQFHLIRNATTVSLGDLDGDGFPDAFVGTGSGDGDWLLRNDGSGILVDHRQGLPWPIGAPTVHLSSEIVDLDRDGRLDLLVSGGWMNNGVVHRPLILRNDGGFSFSVATIGSLPPGNSAITSTARAADFDGDGDLDLYVAGQAPLLSPTGTVFFNLTRQIDAPREVSIGTTLPLHLYGRPGDVLFPFLSASTSPSSRPAWTPVSGMTGKLGVDPSAIVMLPPRPIPTQSGPVTLSIPLPPDPALRSLRIWAQAIHMDSGSPQPTGPHLTNHIRIKLN